VPATPLSGPLARQACWYFAARQWHAAAPQRCGCM